MCPLFYTVKYNINKIRLRNDINLLWYNVTSFSSRSGLGTARPRIKFSGSKSLWVWVWCGTGSAGLWQTWQWNPNGFPHLSSTYDTIPGAWEQTCWMLTWLVALSAAWLCGINICRQLRVWAGTDAAMPQRTALGSVGTLLLATY